MSRLFPQPCPELPDFQSLVVKGLYDASAPVHLLLSHITQHPDATVILLTPSREQFKESLVELNDEWISQNSGHGRVCAVAQRTEIFYPPTLAHLRLLLSMLHEYHGVVHHPKTTLASAPSMLVLHEISSYFNAPSSEATVAAYLSVISSALALTSSWSPQCTQVSKLVVFDSGLAHLKLPILKPLAFGDPAEEPQRNRGTLSILLERYFEWTAEVQIDTQGANASYDDQGDMNQSERDSPVSASTTVMRKSMRLQRCDAGEEPAIVWRWSEFTIPHEEGKAYTTFQWEGEE